MKTILTMPDSDIALLTMAGEGRPFVLNRHTMAEMNTLLDEVERGLADAAAGRTVDAKELRRRLRR